MFMTTTPLTSYTLFSGSSGNSVYVTCGSTSILIDAGKSAKAVTDSLRDIGSDISLVSAIFITHEHSDHVSALEILSKKNHVPVHMTSPSAGSFLSRSTYTKSVAEVHPPIYECYVGDLHIQSFVIPHDSAMNVGYIITSEKGERIGIATDIGYVTDSIKSMLTGCKKVIIESNHDIEMLKDGSYPYHLKQRILSKNGHLSNDGCADLACSLAKSGTKNIMLAHLSKENNLPAIAMNTTVTALSENGCEYGDVTVSVASPDIPMIV